MAEKTQSFVQKKLWPSAIENTTVLSKFVGAMQTHIKMEAIMSEGGTTDHQGLCL
jgi:hypothetical protein